MGELGVREQGVLFFIFKALKNSTLAQLLVFFITAMAFVKFSKKERLTIGSSLLMINILPMVIVELIDRIINNDKPDLLLPALSSFGLSDFYFFISSFIIYSLGQYLIYEKKRVRLASQQNGRQSLTEI